MREHLWSLLELQLCRPTWPPDRSSWYPKEGLGVLVGTTLKHCECARWDAKKQGQDWTETWSQQPWPSKHKWGRGTVPMFTTGLVPCWSAHAGNKSEFESLFMLEGVNPWPSCPRAPCKAAMRESPLHPFHACWDTIDEDTWPAEPFQLSEKSKTKGSVAAVHSKQQVVLSFASSPDQLGPGPMEAPRSGTGTPERGRC